MSKSNVKKDILAPVLVLTVICLVVSAALAFTNMATEPVITAAAAARAEAARMEVLPEADGFTEVTATDFPPAVKSVFRADNGAGWVITLTANGYGGVMEILCGIDSSGKITSTRLLDHAETQGMGAKAADAPYADQYIGIDKAGLSGVDAISGATVTSEAYAAAIEHAFVAYMAAKEVS